jgi:hypothetical protein
VWLRAKYGTTTFIQRVTDVAFTGATGTFLAVQLAAGTLHFGAGFYFVRTLALSGEVLFYREVNNVIVRLYTEDIFRKFNSSACVLSLYV